MILPTASRSKIMQINKNCETETRLENLVPIPGCWQTDPHLVHWLSSLCAPKSWTAAHCVSTCNWRWTEATMHLERGDKSLPSSAVGPENIIQFCTYRQSTEVLKKQTAHFLAKNLYSGVFRYLQPLSQYYSQCQFWMMQPDVFMSLTSLHPNNEQLLVIVSN